MSVGREFEGVDLQEALASAALALGREAQQLHYEVLDEGRRGVMGLGFKPIRIWVEVDEAQGARLQAEAAPVQVTKDPERRAVEEMLHRMIFLMGLDLRVRSHPTEDGLRLELSGPDRRLLLKKDGELLEALQLVVHRMARRQWPAIPRIRLECEGHDLRHDEEVAELAREVAHQVHRTRAAKTLHPMNPYDRRLVHIAVQEFPGLASRSEGDGFLKAVTVFTVASAPLEGEP